MANPEPVIIPAMAVLAAVILLLIRLILAASCVTVANPEPVIIPEIAVLAATMLAAMAEFSVLT